MKKSLARLLPFFLITVLWVSASPGGDSSPTSNETATDSQDFRTLGQTLEKISGERGIDVYLDERLRDRPGPGNLFEKEETEGALRRIISPYSHAFSYVGASKADSRMEGVWVFEGADPAEVDFMVFPGTKPGTAASGTGKTYATARIGETGRTIKGKDLLKQGVRFTRDPLGAPVINSRKAHQPPDFKPDADAMRQTRAEALRRQKVEEIRRNQVRRRNLLRKQEEKARSVRDAENGEGLRFTKEKPFSDQP